MKQFLLASASAWAVLALGLPAHAGIDAAKIAGHIKILASDAFEGRGPATAGEVKTVKYLTEQFKAVGLQPGGDLLKDGKRAWTQDVPLAQFDNKDPIKVSVTVGGQVQTWAQGDQIAIRAPQTGADHVTVKDAPVVFIGYGVKAPERNWDDFKGYDLKGKIALVLVNDPDFETLKKLAQTRDFKPVALTGVTFSTDIAVDAKKIVSKNVVGLLPGTKHPEEKVIYTAHWDHLGVGLADAKGDRFYNGALDNASGTSVLIEMGRAAAAQPRTERSMLFLAVTAEEKGLLGSEYYATHPLYPLGTTVADINMDGVATNGPSKDFSTSGDAPLTLQDDLIEVAKGYNMTYSPDPRPGAGSFFRSDHFSFAKRGVPAISFGGGQDLVNGGKARGAALQKAYTTERYHQPADEYSPDWDLSGAARNADMLLVLGTKLANSRAWPEWKAGSEFKAERDKTAAARK